MSLLFNSPNRWYISAMAIIRSKRFFVSLCVGIFFCILPASADTQGQTVTFFVNTNFDQYGRSTLSATLQYVGVHTYFYVDDRYWNALTQSQQTLALTNIQTLAQEFDTKIYPRETDIWGSEPNPGIDGDPRITILLQSMRQGNGGYFETINEYSTREATTSNQREMISITLDGLGSSLLNGFLAHEFQHMISFKQKELTFRVSEETWLNEIRSEYATHVAGYASPYSGSYLERRIVAFLQSPSDSLTEWPNTPADYGVAMAFAEYITGHYGVGVLSETLHSPRVGMGSLNDFLLQHHYSETFSDIFGNWMVATYINDRAVNSIYGYGNPDLASLHVGPTFQQFLGMGTESTTTLSIKNWQPMWQVWPIIRPTTPFAVKLDFTGEPNQNFLAMYTALFDDGTYAVGRVQFNDGNETVVIADQGQPAKRIAQVIVAVTAANQQLEAGVYQSHSLTVHASLTTDQSLVSKAAPLNSLSGSVGDGALIKRNANEQETYVLWGKYKRYLKPEVIRLYGQLDPTRVVALDDTPFNAYMTSNYVRSINDQKVYAVWPDGTKHWLHITPQQWDASGRDWNSIFIINDAELNFYQTGVDITR